MNLYFKIWVDTIIKIRKNPLRKEDWKWMIQIYMAIAMALNLMFLLAILQRNIFNFSFYDIEINLFSSKILNNLLSGFILFFLPFLLINYLLIFKNKKYLDLIKKYKSENGNYFFRYFFTSLFLPLLVLIIAFILK
jgi:succinate dehydrogenase hydrophobic anchor subunit